MKLHTQLYGQICDEPVADDEDNNNKNTRIQIKKLINAS